MSYRYMRVIDLFDLPMETREEKKQYSSFRKTLLKSGFVMLQKSVYSKIALNQTVEKAIKERIFKNRPKFGLVQMLSVTEKQFQSIENLIGESSSQTINNDKRIIVL